MLTFHYYETLLLFPVLHVRDNAARNISHTWHIFPSFELFSVNIFKAKLSPKVDIDIIFPSHLLLHYFLKGT